MAVWTKGPTVDRTLTFVPVTRDEALALARGTEPRCPRQAFSATPELVAALGYQPEQDEDAEYAALVLASVWSLAHDGVRMVLVAELDPSAIGGGDEPDNGGITISKLPRGAVVAFFTDEPEAREVAARAASAARDHDIDAAWELPDVQELITGHDLLWHSADELSTLADEG